jgi:hypothetical protein
MNCDPDETTCTSCGSGNFLINNICDTQCPDGTFEDTINNICAICDSPCVNCENNATTCTSCSSGHFLSN